MRKEGTKQYRYLAGVDEVGRGPIAGPVTVGIFLVPVHEKENIGKMCKDSGARDSKKMTEKKREVFVQECNKLLSRSDAHTNGKIFLASASASCIDRHGIMHALERAVQKVLKKVEAEGISLEEVFFSLDASLPFPLPTNQYEHMTKGDEKEILISVASIFAKVHRDTLMKNYAKKYPQYGFEKHKGYGTQQHYEAIRQYGCSPIHRTSWIRIDSA